MRIHEASVVAKMDYKSVSVQKVLLQREMKPLKIEIDQNELSPEELYAKVVQYRVFEEYQMLCDKRIEQLANLIDINQVFKFLN